MKNKITLSLLFLIIICNSYSSNIEANTDVDYYAIQTKFDYIEPKNYSIKATSSVIVIDSNEAFISHGFPGNGSETNPFLIQDIEIETDSEIGIAVFDTSKCFSIQNCTIQARDVSIYLFNNTGNYIGLEENLCISCDYWGIYIVLCANLTISRNTIVDNRVGMGLFASSLSIVNNNLCYDNEYGIVGEYLDNISFVENSCLFNVISGLDLAYANQLFIHKNLCTNSRYGIDVYGTSNSILSENTLEYTDDGFYNYGLENVSMVRNEFNYNYVGISNANSNNVTISDNHCSDGTYGMRIIATHSSIFRDNICNNNSLDGMYFHSCSSSSVVNNTCNENSDNGIRIACPNKKFEDNLQLINNTCNNNIYGINLYVVDSISIIDNFCNENSKYGIKMEDSNYNNIIGNTFQENIGYAVCISDFTSTWNIVYGNYFICNNVAGTLNGFSQVFDNSYNNQWYDYDSNTGNYWTDFGGVGEYQIDGNYNRTDPYPLIYNYECCLTCETPEESYIDMIIVIVSTLGIATIRFWKKKLDRIY